MTLEKQRSVDPAEIAKFNRLSTTWWDEAGPMWPLHRLNKFRIEVIEQVICQQRNIDTACDKPFRNLKVLDIGCGGGILSESMARRGATVHGVDVSPGNIHAARLHAETEKDALVQRINYELCSAEELVTRDQRYDIVLNMEVVEHVLDLGGFMHSCNSLVAPGGIQFVSTINRNPVAWFTAIIGAEYILRWLPKGTHQYGKLVKPGELLALLQQDDFEILQRTGVAVNPFTGNMSSRKSEMVSYMVAALKSS